MSLRSFVIEWAVFVFAIWSVATLVGHARRQQRRAKREALGRPTGPIVGDTRHWRREEPAEIGLIAAALQKLGVPHERAPFVHGLRPPLRLTETGVLVDYCPPGAKAHAEELVERRARMYRRHGHRAIVLGPADMVDVEKSLRRRLALLSPA